MTQPLTIKMDPRVKITPEVEQIFALTKQMENYAREAVKSYTEAVALRDKWKSATTPSARLKKLTDLEPELDKMSGQLITAVMSMQASEMPPTATEVAGCKKQAAAFTALMAQWSALKQ